MSATMKAAVHLGAGHEEHLRIRASQNIVRYLAEFDPESPGISTIEWNTGPWKIYFAT